MTPHLLEKDDRLISALEALKNFAVEAVQSDEAFKENSAYVEKYMPHLKSVYLKELDLAIKANLSKLNKFKKYENSIG